MSIQLRRQSRRRSIQHSDPGKILDLVMSLNDESCASLQIKINSYLREECEAETVLLIVIHGVGNEAFIEAVGVTSMPRKLKICMTPKLNHILKSAMEETDTLAHFGTDFQAIVTPHIAKDSMKKRIVLFPVPDKPFSVIACVIAPNMMDENVACIVHESFLFCWPVLKKTVALEYECTLKQKCQQLLRVARRLFSQVASLETLLRLAMGQAKQLTKAEYCSVMLVDVDTMELVDLTNTNSQDDKETVERRFPMNIGLTGQVINTGNLINAKSVKDYPAFCPDIDCYPGVECKSLLCFPIREQTGIIGVGLLINKIGDPYFDAMDEEMALAFSIYCGVCIMHSVVYQKIQEAHIRNTLANELVMYHMQVGDSEVARMLDCSGYHNHPHLSSLHFNLRALPLRELPCYVLKMFSELGYDKRDNIHTLAAEMALIDPDVRLSTSERIVHNDVKLEVNEGSDFYSDFEYKFDVGGKNTVFTDPWMNQIPDYENLDEPLQRIINEIQNAMDNSIDRMSVISDDYGWVSDFGTFRGGRVKFLGLASGSIEDYNTGYDAFTDIRSEDIMDHIARQINRYARQTIDELKANGKLKYSSRLRQWVDTDAEELYVLFVIFMYMGIGKLPTQKEY